jgi:Short C-terminal domain
MSFRDKARQRLQERRDQAADPTGGQDDADQPADTPPAGQAQPIEPAAGQPDYAAELEQLAKLKSEGILTDEEYAAKKKQILGI